MISTYCGIVGWVNANYFYYTMDNWQALCEGKPPSNGLIRWHAAISLRPEFQIVPKLYDDFFHFRILFAEPHRTEPNKEKHIKKVRA